MKPGLAISKWEKAACKAEERVTKEREPWVMSQWLMQKKRQGF